MASTTKTTNLELSQFVGTDKPAWLTDYNGDMQKIDNGYKKLEDANTATQADLDATKQDLSGSQTDIADVKADMQALEAQDIAIGNRLTVVEGNYDTMHHEVAINQQDIATNKKDIADMKPYATVAANKKVGLFAGANVTRPAFDTNSTEASIGVEDTNNDIERRILFGKFFESPATSNKETQLIMDVLKPSDNYSVTESTSIIMPAGGVHFEYIDDENVGIHIKLNATKFISIKCGKTTGVSLDLNVNGIVTKLFNIPVPVTP